MIPGKKNKSTTYVLSEVKGMDIIMKNIKRIHWGIGNCFLIQENNNAILIDTARDKYKYRILEECKKLNIRLIVLTHGHLDHIQNAAFLSKELGVPIAMQKLDYKLTRDNMLEPLYAHTILGKLVLASVTRSFKKDKIESFEPEIFLQEGDSLIDYGINAEIIGLPGHTKGSIGIYAWHEELIVGDALMNIIHPTVSMLYENWNCTQNSAKKISSLPAKIVHFGHGKSTVNRNWIL